MIYREKFTIVSEILESLELSGPVKSGKIRIAGNTCRKGLFFRNDGASGWVQPWGKAISTGER